METSQLLAPFLAFVLGILAEPLKKLVTREKRFLDIDIVENPVISIRGKLPPQLADLGSFTNNVTEFHAKVTNAGSRIVKQCTFRLEAPDSTIAAFDVTTYPPEIIEYGATKAKDGASVVLRNFNLEPGQFLECQLYVVSENIPKLKAHGTSSEDAVAWRQSDSTRVTLLEDHGLALFRLYIFAEFIGPLISAIGYVLGSLAIAASSQNTIQFGAIGVLGTLGSILKLYFYLRMIPHLTVLMRVVVGRLQKRNAERATAQADRPGAQAALSMPSSDSLR